MDKRNKYNAFWPKINDMKTANAAIKNGVIASGFVAFITALFAAFGLIDAFAWVDAALFVGVGFGIWLKSRTAAIIGASLFVYEKIYQIIEARKIGGGFIVAILVLLYFIHAVRGTLAYHKLMKSSQKPTNITDAA